MKISGLYEIADGLAVGRAWMRLARVLAVAGGDSRRAAASSCAIICFLATVRAAAPIFGDGVPGLEQALTETRLRTADRGTPAT